MRSAGVLSDNKLVRLACRYADACHVAIHSASYMPHWPHVLTLVKLIMPSEAAWGRSMRAQTGSQRLRSCTLLLCTCHWVLCPAACLLCSGKGLQHLAIGVNLMMTSTTAVLAQGLAAARELTSSLLLQLYSVLATNTGQTDKVQNMKKHFIFMIQREGMYSTTSDGLIATVCSFIVCYITHTHTHLLCVGHVKR